MVGSSALGQRNTLNISPAGIVTANFLPSGSVAMAKISVRSRNILPLSKCTSPYSSAVLVSVITVDNGA